jgi:hypothetical protein
VILARKVGVAGVALGTIIGYLATDVWYGPRFFLTHYGLQPSDLARPLLRSLLALLLFLPLVATVSILSRTGGWPRLIGTALFGGGAWVCLVVGVLLSSEQRRLALRRALDLGSFLSRRGNAES